MGANMLERLCMPLRVRPSIATGRRRAAIQPVDRRPAGAQLGCRPVDNRLHGRSSMGTMTTYEALARRRCLVCEFTEDVWEVLDTDEIGPPCSRCRAPTERVAVVERRRVSAKANPHAAALGRLGGLKGGPARAARLTPARRRAIACRAACARWHYGKGPVEG